MDTPPERAFDDLGQLAAQCCNAPVALVTFLDERRQWFKAEIGVELREMPIQIAVCAHAISGPDDVFVVPDLALDERFKAFPYVQSGLRLRFYAGAPIRAEDGTPLGTICVLDTQPRSDGLTAEQRRSLAALARMVGDQLSSRRTNALLRQNEQRYRALTAASSSVVWCASPEGEITDGWSWEDFSGQTLQQGVAGGWLERVHPEDKAGLLGLWAHNVARGTIHNADFRILDFSAEYRWMVARAVPIRDETGTVVEWIGALTNIHEQRLVQLALAESEDHYRHSVELNPQIPWIADADGNILEIGPRWTELTGLDKAQSLGQSWAMAMHKDDYASVYANWAIHLSSGHAIDAEYRVRLADGTHHWMRARAAARRDENGRIVRWYGTLEDIHEHKLAQLALLESEAKLAGVLESTNDKVIVVDQEWQIVYANRRALQAFQSRNLAVGTNLWTSFAEDESGIFRHQLEAAMAQGHAKSFESSLSGGSMWLEVHAQASGGVLTLFMRDITEAHQARERIAHLAHHDSLTGLPNRAMFLERLDQSIAAAAAGGSVGVIYLDLDAFKDINDTLGHDAGDAVLVAAAQALQTAVPSGAVAARIGGDEFAVLYAEQCSSEKMEALARKLKKALAAPALFEGHELSCKASFGLALYPQSDNRPGELMKNADLALYEAKRAGGNQYAFFTPKIRQVVQNRVSALSCARDALSRDAIMPFYQPKVSLETGRICGFEALLRWEHPRSGIQLPGLIKEAFDDPLLSLELGKRMLERVIADMHTWRSVGVAFGSVAINLSADQFFRTDVATTILTSLEQAELHPHDLEVEVTESVFLGDGSDAVAHALDKLHEAGVQIALDDFGTGFASLSHLNKFPVSWLKIDRSFVSDMGRDPDADAIVAAVIGLSQTLGIQVVAEGVETIEQWNILQRKGCDVAQGYLISKAMNAERVPGFIRNWSPPGATGRGQQSHRRAAS